MAALSDATLLAISRISVGAQVADPTDFTALTSAQVMAKFELSSYGGGGTLYALGSDGDYDALDPDDPPVTDLGLWPVRAFVNLYPNPIWSGAVAGTPGTHPTGFSSTTGTINAIELGMYKQTPAIRFDMSDVSTVRPLYFTNRALAGAASFKCFARGVVSGGTSPNTLKAMFNDGVGYHINTVADDDQWRTHVLSFTAGGSVVRGSCIWTDATALNEWVAGVQLVAGVYNPPVLALSSAATTTKLAAITQREVSVWKPFVVVIDATTGEDPGAHQVFYSLSRSANELIEIYRATSTDQMTLKIRSGGVDYTDALGSVADNTAFTLAVNVFARSSAASLNGGTTQVLVAPKPSGVLTLESIGCKHDGTLQCGGPIAECNLIHPAVYTAEQLEAA